MGWGNIFKNHHNFGEEYDRVMKNASDENKRRGKELFDELDRIGEEIEEDDSVEIPSWVKKKDKNRR